ncbi:plasmid stabilization protein [Phytoactinopolyspora alkaliphila]|uniref:Plasmid stabilization protein n=1 Tax=Phytoactinopolyspora alkaliphila TaxID=1783498 RepID=A0A6N9YM76_9ACTN|nr:right-handed parallel beta-helix repeat-containing protein [Phytoactinopolyspora alkaliphila]NED96055.1 plasmid stabilization protein [Phytoactinopolyspora alkaliphila]
MGMCGAAGRRRLGIAVIVFIGLLASACGQGGDDEPGGSDSNDAAGDGAVIRVPEDAATIAEGLEQVTSGGMVLVGPGIYPEEVTIDKPDVTLRGTDRNAVVIDGEGTRSFGVFASAHGVRIENLTVHSTLFYGVLVTGMHDENGPLAHGGPGYTELDPAEFPPVERFSIDHVTAYNNGLYGIYAFNARHGSITDSYTSGSADSGFYVGQCEQCDILVTSNVAERNAIGFENANASDSLMIAGNRFSGNRIGMTLISSYQEAFTPQRENVVVGNLISENTSDDSPAHALGGFGVGLAVNGGQRNLVSANRIEGNPHSGISLSNAEDIPAVENRFIGNVLGGNGVDVVDQSAARAPSAANCFEENTATTASPSVLLDMSCPADDSADEPASADDSPRVEAPPGISFLKVPVPPDQPSRIDVETVPAPLPDSVDMPSEAEFGVPDTTLLAERVGTA